MFCWNDGFSQLLVQGFPEHQPQEFFLIGILHIVNKDLVEGVEAMLVVGLILERLSEFLVERFVVLEVFFPLKLGEILL